MFSYLSLSCSSVPDHWYPRTDLKKRALVCVCGWVGGCVWVGGGGVCASIFVILRGGVCVMLAARCAV